MEQHEEVFFRTLRSALWGETLQIPEGFNNWGKVMKLAKAQAVTGLVGDVILRTPEIMASLPDKAAEYVQEIPMKNIVMHTVLNNTLILAVKTLCDHGIEPVLLKGQGLARYYPVPELRQCGDIDLYVGEENYEKAYEALKGIVTEIDEKENIRRGLHFHAKIHSILLEIHHEVEYVFRKSYEKLFRSKVQTGLTGDLPVLNFGDSAVNVPEVSFNAFYVFYHLWRHYMASGVGLRQLCDWMLFLNAKKDEIDLEYLEAFINEMNLMDAWQTFGCILVGHLGMPQENFPFYDQRNRKYSDRLLKMIMAEGNFGQSGPYVRVRKKSYLYEKWFSFRCHVGRIFNMVMIFPRLSYDSMVYMLTGGIGQVYKDIKSGIVLDTEK